MEHAAVWQKWEPKIDDKIKLIKGGFDTGTMYLNTILPENGKYRIIATAMPAIARRRAWKSYHNMTLREVMEACAAECRMEYGLYGIEGEIHYTYLERRNEGCAAFLDRLIELEGGVLKTINGRLCAIGVVWAQAQEAGKKIELAADQEGVQHIKQEANKWAGLKILTPYAEVSAEDRSAKGEIRPVETRLPARDVVQAGRWARGLLLHNNRKTEQLLINTQLDTGFTAMTRVDVTSHTEANGQWLVDEVVHDLKNARTQTRLLRCVSGIA
jgi:hypothetical protein